MSTPGLIGGGQVPRSGNVSLVHHGILLLGERLEFRRHVLEGLRQPLESGIIYIQSCNLAGVLNRNVFATLAARLMTGMGSGRGS
jgi:magnesium chelatase family protein